MTHGYSHGLSGIPPSLSNSDEERCFRLPFEVGRNNLVGQDIILDDLDYSRRFANIYEDKYQGILYCEDDPIIGLQNLFKVLQGFYVEDNEILHIHVQRLVLKLLLYSQVNPPNGFALDPRDYLKYNLLYGTDFTSWLKKARQAMMIQSLSKSLIEDNKFFIKSVKENMFNIILEDKRYDYDSFFHEQHLLRFKEDADDFAWSFKEINEDDRWYSLFRNAAETFLRRYKLHEIKQCDQDEMATWISDSVTMTDDGPILNRRLMRQMAIEGTTQEEINLSREQAYFRFKRKSVFVAPGNARDTWQCFPRTLFKVKRISHILRQVVDHLPNSAMADPKKAWDRRKKLHSKETLYFHFDYKKCGLTVNRKLLVILGEVLESIYPGQGFDELIHFQHVKVENGESELHPIRGVGLGNCNEGVTLIQCVIGYLLKTVRHLDGIFFNDDGVYCGPFDEIQRSFGWILTSISKLGMIINLKKSFISECNVFCEDYFISQDNMSYEKVQSLIIPFSEVFFVNNISRAKILCNDLCRNLVGRRVKIDLFYSLVSWWGYEFHPSESWWPFEFGGWQRYGQTSINECLNVIYYPTDFCPKEEKGSTPFFKEWVHYLISSQKIREICRFRGNIRYRKYVQNPFIGPELNYPHSEKTEEWISQLGILSNDARKKTFNDMYNIRGMKNAKPKIKLGKANKLEILRRVIWNSFKRFRSHNERTVFTENPGEVLNILHFLRGNEISPQMYEPPRWTITRWEDLTSSNYDIIGRVLFPDNYKFGSNDTLAMFKAMESVNNGYLVEGARPDKLRIYNQKLENRPIVSNERFKIPHGSIPSIGAWIKLFFGKRKFAMIYYASRYDRFPIGTVDLPHSNELEHILKDGIRSIFPKTRKKYWRAVRSAKHLPDFDHILDSFHCREYHDEDEFSLALDILEDYIEQSSQHVPSVDENTWEDFCDDLLEATVDWDLVKFQFGEIDFEEVLFEYELEYGFEPEFYSDPEDFDFDFEESPSRTTLASLKECESPDL
jgi:hypothetical protein